MTTTQAIACALHNTSEQCDEQLNHRIDSQTGQCMESGWIFNGGDFYIADEARAEALCQKLWGQSISEAYDEDDEAVYYTEWNDHPEPGQQEEKKVTPTHESIIKDISSTLNEHQVLDLLAEIAKTYELPGAGYFGTEDVALAYEHLAETAALPPLQKQDAGSLREHIFYSQWNVSMAGENSDTLEIAVSEEFGNWYQESETMQQEREDKNNPSWHEQVQSYLSSQQ